MKPSHTPQTICKFLMNAVADGLKIKRQNRAGASGGALATAKAMAIAGILCSGIASNAASINWIGSSDNNYTNTAAWNGGVVPGVADTAVIGNTMLASATVNYTNPVAGFFGTNRLSLLIMNTNTVSGTSTFLMSDGTLWITNAGTAFSLGAANGAVDTFIQSGGTLVVARPSSGLAYYQDAFLPGNATGSHGTYTISGGLLDILCGMEIGNSGSGTFNVNGGIVVDNGWCGVRGGTTTNVDSGTFNQTAGTMYILRNPATDTTANAGGLSLGQSGYLPSANISGGNLYATQIRMGLINTAATNSLNINGGSLYIGYLGVYTNIYNANANTILNINIGGGTFHTLDIIPVVTNAVGSTVGSTNTILADGTNWTWRSGASVNLTNNTFVVNGVTGPGYVTFAPEATRTITLSNIWSGVGGLAMSGPGTLSICAPDTYSGATALNGGRINLGANGSIAGSSSIQLASGTTLDASGRADGTLTLASGQTLTGVGTVNGAISVGSGATNSPGTSSTIGTLNNTGSMLLQSGGTLIVKVQNAMTGPGVGNDEITVSGNIGEVATTASKFIVKLVSLDGAGVAGNDVTNFNSATNYTWTIATGTITNFNASTVTVDTSSFGNSFAVSSGQFFVDSTGNSLVIYFKPGNSTASGTGPSIGTPGLNANQNPTFNGFGVPTYVYGVESAPSVTGPWIEAGNTTAGSNGAWSFTDLTQTNPGTIFYRIYYPDNPSHPPQ